MKLPYRVGDSFALPIGDGRLFPAQIVACSHHVVDIVVGNAAAREIVELTVSDRALVLHRWRRDGHNGCPSSTLHGACPERSRRARVGKGRWIGAALAERVVASRVGLGELVQPPLRVREGVFSAEYPCIRDAQDLAALQGTPLDYAIVAGEVNLRAVAEAFPNLRHLRIAGRFRVDARALVAFGSLEALDLSDVDLASAGTLALLPVLALRLARLNARIDLEALTKLRLRALSLECLRDVRGIAAIAQWRSLEQLEMLEFWQIALGDVMPLLDMPNLLRAEVDIGGRRKNVELYRRANWAYPWPFDVVATCPAPSIAPPVRNG